MKSWFIKTPICNLIKHRFIVVVGNVTKCEGMLHGAGHAEASGAEAGCVAGLGYRQWGYIHWTSNPSAVHCSGMGMMKVNMNQGEFTSLAI